MLRIAWILAQMLKLAPASYSWGAGFDSFPPYTIPVAELSSIILQHTDVLK
jgi:hypothetical protein